MKRTGIVFSFVFVFFSSIAQAAPPLDWIHKASVPVRVFVVTREGRVPLKWSSEDAQEIVDDLNSKFEGYVTFELHTQKQIEYPDYFNVRGGNLFDRLYLALSDLGIHNAGDSAGYMNFFVLNSMGSGRNRVLSWNGLNFPLKSGGNVPAALILPPSRNQKAHVLSAAGLMGIEWTVLPSLRRPILYQYFGCSRAWPLVYNIFPNRYRASPEIRATYLEAKRNFMSALKSAVNSTLFTQPVYGPAFEEIIRCWLTESDLLSIR